VVSESAAILIHLTNAHPAAALAPAAVLPLMLTFCSGWSSCPQTRTRRRCGSSIQPAILPSARPPQRRSRSKPGRLDRPLRDPAHRASTYVLGAQLSAADHYLHMLAGWYPDEAALASRLPKLRQHAELLRQRPATRKAEKEHSDS